MKKFSKKDFIYGVLAAAAFLMLMGAARSDSGAGRYAVSVGGGANTYSVCVTDTLTGETKCQQGGGPKEHTFSPNF